MTQLASRQETVWETFNYDMVHFENVRGLHNQQKLLHPGKERSFNVISYNNPNPNIKLQS